MPSTSKLAVELWIAGSPTAYNWSPLVEYVVRNLERESDPKAVFDREEELKRKIKSIVHCDATKDSIVDLEAFDVGKPFDIVTTSSCEDVCAVSKEHYKSTVAKLCKMLKPNGYLCMFGVFDESFYTSGADPANFLTGASPMCSNCRGVRGHPPPGNFEI